MIEEKIEGVLLEKIQPFAHKIYGSIGRIIVLLFVGMSIGLFIGSKIYSYKMYEVTTTGRMLYQEKVYDVMLSEKVAAPTAVKVK